MAAVSLPTLPYQGLLAASPWPAALAKSLTCCFRWPRLVLHAAGAAFSFDSHVQQSTASAYSGRVLSQA
jgi:hypothetical protein